MENTNGQMEEVNPEVWKPETEGDVLEGILIDKVISGNPEESNRYYVETTQGIKLVWGSAIIDDRMRFVDVGTYIRITFKERKDIGKGKTLKVFKVERRKEAPKASPISIIEQVKVPSEEFVG